MNKSWKFKFTVNQIYCTIYFLFYIKYIFYYKIKAINITKLCSKFEVDITKIEVPMRFCLGVVPKIATGCH